MCRLIIIYFLVSLQLCLAQEKSKQWAQKADKLYRDSNYTEAEEFYRKANAENPDFNSQYNLANALYKQGRYNEAKLAYEIAASQKDAVDHKKAMAHFNLGNTQVNAKKYESAIDHYKESLKLQPSDPATKLNLAKAIQLKKIEKQQQQKQEDQNKDKNDPQKDQQQKDKNNPQKEEQSKPEDKDKKKNSQPNDENKPSENKKEQSQNAEESKSGLSKQEADQILKMIDNKDKKTKEKLQMNKRRKSSNLKDW